MSTTENAQNGIIGGYGGGNANIYRVMTAFAAIAWYNSIELLILIFVVFKKYQGLYFWSMLLTSAAIIPYEVGAWGRQVGIIHSSVAGQIISSIGWTFMVTGQSVVLYSRLHLVTQDRKILRGVLWMIIIDFIVLWTPTIVLAVGSQTSQSHLFVNGYAVMEKIQMTIWSLQELIISGVYLWEVHKTLKMVYEGGTRKVLYELIAINVVIIILDIALLTVEFLNLYQIEVTLKGMIYSIKLKLEFGVLSKLVKIVTHNHETHTVGSTEVTEIFPATMSPVVTRDSLNKGPQYIEYANSSGSGSNDWRLGSADHSLELEKCRQLSRRRSSLTELYPGRLDLIMNSPPNSPI